MVKGQENKTKQTNEQNIRIQGDPKRLGYVIYIK